MTLESWLSWRRLANICLQNFVKRRDFVIKQDGFAYNLRLYFYLFIFMNHLKSVGERRLEAPSVDKLSLTARCLLRRDAVGA